MYINPGLVVSNNANHCFENVLPHMTEEGPRGPNDARPLCISQRITGRRFGVENQGLVGEAKTNILTSSVTTSILSCSCHIWMRHCCFTS